MRRELLQQPERGGVQTEPESSCQRFRAAYRPDVENLLRARVHLAVHLWQCVANTPVPMNSMARETPWFDDEAIVPAFGGPAALREAV